MNMNSLSFDLVYIYMKPNSAYNIPGDLNVSLTDKNATVTGIQPILNLAVYL